MLVTGGRGLLGTEVASLFRGEFAVTSVDLEECDVTSRAACGRAIGDIRPDVVVHCAAYTAVDRAEGEADRALSVNGEGTRNVARECRKSGAFLVTYGSDYIFDGAAGRPYAEDDAPRPLSAYGRSKLAAEIALREEAARHLLIRSQWLYGPHGRNFVFAILEKAARGEPLRVVSDQVGCPTHARDLARATRALLAAGAAGTFHFSNEGETTWYGFAALVLERTGRGTGSLHPAASSELGYPARRPPYSVLSKEKYRRATGASPRSWDEAAIEFLEKEL